MFLRRKPPLRPVKRSSYHPRPVSPTPRQATSVSSLQTFFRAVVMLATLGLLAKTWYHYGPNVTELQAIGGRVAEVATEAWANYWQAPASNAHAAADTPPPAPFVPQPSGPLKPPPLATSLNPLPADRGPVQLAENLAIAAAPTPTRPVPNRLPSTKTLEPVINPVPDAELEAIRARLSQLGVVEQQLKPWGSQGEFVRFTCSATWTNLSHYTRHFEAIASTPLDAVKQVAAEIEAWRAAQ
jgi:hypothetical protein